MTSEEWPKGGEYPLVAFSGDLAAINRFITVFIVFRRNFGFSSSHYTDFMGSTDILNFPTLGFMLLLTTTP